MLVSCLCPTFNRPSLLAECVYWFTVQDYAERELVILNDNPAMTLRCSVPGVRCVNVRQRFGSIGEKYNALIELARGNILLPWEDDDIGLPWRVSQSVSRLGAYLYWNPRGSWYEQSGTLHKDHTHGYCLNASAIRREAFGIVPMPTNNKWDAEWCGVVDLLNSVPRSPDVLTSCREWSYVYRWGVTRHLSGHGNMDAAYAAAERPEGVYDIEPRMHRDYLRDIQCAC